MSGNRVLLAGASGLIGTSVIRSLQAKRISPVVLHRRPPSGAEGDQGFWDPYAGQSVLHPERYQGVSAAIVLSGVNIAGHRWTPSYKQEILESRVNPTRAMATLAAGFEPKPAVLLCASAIGIYGQRGDELLTEASGPGSGFLPELCQAWERAAQPAEEAGIRVVYLRFGVVLSPQAGALRKMLPLFRAGLGGRLGNGRQWMSWIALPDVARILEFALERSDLSGAVNVTSPQPVTNAEFTRSVGRALHRPAWLPAPALALRLAFGEMAQATMLASTRVVPASLISAGFQFEYPQLDAALAAMLPG